MGRDKGLVSSEDGLAVWGGEEGEGEGEAGGGGCRRTRQERTPVRPQGQQWGRKKRQRWTRSEVQGLLLAGPGCPGRAEVRAPRDLGAERWRDALERRPFRALE